MGKSQCKNIRSMKSQDSLSPSKITSTIVMATNESDLDKIAEKQLRKTITNMFRELKKVRNKLMNEFKEHPTNLLSEF